MNCGDLLKRQIIKNLLGEQDLCWYGMQRTSKCYMRQIAWKANVKNNKRENFPS